MLRNDHATGNWNFEEEIDALTERWEAEDTNCKNDETTEILKNILQASSSSQKES